MSAREGPSGPVADAELPALFAPLAGLARLGLAVSGGPDSTALLLLAHRWAGAPGGPSLRVLTVDHGLRPAAADEAAGVVALATRLGHPADLLVWRHDGAPPVADLQAAARQARYRLLADAARTAGLDAVLLAHTLDDLAETLVMRMARGSGVRGLAGMPAERMVHGVRFVRPLLGIRKARLVATVAAAGLTAVDDPSNASERFLRARVRRLMPALADLGLTPERLADTARRLARAADAVDAMTARLAETAVRDHGGVCAVDVGALRTAPEEVALRLVADLVRAVRPAAYLPRAAPLEDWMAAVRAEGMVRRRTLAGVVLDLRKERVWIYAEAGRGGYPEVAVPGPGRYVWDDRFEVDVAGSVAPAPGSSPAPAATTCRAPHPPRSPGWTVAEARARPSARSAGFRRGTVRTIREFALIFGTPFARAEGLPPFRAVTARFGRSLGLATTGGGPMLSPRVWRARPSSPP